MKTVKPLVLLICITLLAISCRSKEERATELIKNELSKTLYDFDSYQPIETTVKEAKQNIYNDSICWTLGAALAYEMQQVSKYVDQYEKAKELMNIWGRPTYYSSAYSDSQYYKHKKEYDDALTKASEKINVCKVLVKTLKDSAEQLDTTKIIGWEVLHRFRCKTKGGNSTIGDYRYIISEDFKSVIICEDIDDDKLIRNLLTEIQLDDWDDIIK